VSLTTFERHARFACYHAPNTRALRVGSIATKGPVTIEDRIVTDAAGEERLARVTVAIVPASDFATLPARQTAVRDVMLATEYTVRDVRKIEDGLTLELWLAEVVS